MVPVAGIRPTSVVHDRHGSVYMDTNPAPTREQPVAAQNVAGAAQKLDGCSARLT
jgi:hypothetical protein